MNAAKVGCIIRMCKKMWHPYRKYTSIIPETRPFRRFFVRKGRVSGILLGTFLLEPAICAGRALE